MLPSNLLKRMLFPLYIVVRSFLVMRHAKAPHLRRSSVRLFICFKLCSPGSSRTVVFSDRNGILEKHRISAVQAFGTFSFGHIMLSQLQLTLRSYLLPC